MIRSMFGFADIVEKYCAKSEKDMYLDYVFMTWAAVIDDFDHENQSLNYRQAVLNYFLENFDLLPHATAFAFIKACARFLDMLIDIKNLLFLTFGIDLIRQIKNFLSVRINLFLNYPRLKDGGFHYSRRVLTRTDNGAGTTEINF